MHLPVTLIMVIWEWMDVKAMPHVAPCHLHFAHTSEQGKKNLLVYKAIPIVMKFNWVKILAVSLSSGAAWAAKHFQHLLLFQISENCNFLFPSLFQFQWKLPFCHWYLLMLMWLVILNTNSFFWIAHAQLCLYIFRVYSNSIPQIYHDIH